jgi:predicted nuclease of predicted toxin-antitoxin system
VRILLDQNLSPRLVRRLGDILPGMESVYEHDLVRASDPFIFEWARREGFAAVISADGDFVQLVERIGPPSRAFHLSVFAALLVILPP